MDRASTAVSAFVMDQTTITVLSSLFGIVVSALVGWLIARQNREASLDVARQETSATVSSSKEAAEQEAYTRARVSLESTIAGLERENVRIQRVADSALAAAAACGALSGEQATQITDLGSQVAHLRNQDQAKQRIIDRMREELNDAKAALRIAVHDDEDPTRG